MGDLQAITDRVEIEALNGELTDAVMMHDYDRLASLFTPGGAVRIPHIGAEAVSREETRARGRAAAGPARVLRADHAPGHDPAGRRHRFRRAYICELIRLRDGSSELNYAVYHDRYQRTGDGWRFTERVYGIRYLDSTPLAGSAPDAAGATR